MNVVMTRIFSVIVLCISLFHGTVGVVNPSECRSLMDLFLVIDGSDSISFEDFELLRKAIGQMITQIDLGPDKARIGMLVYSSDVPAASEHPFSYDRAYLTNAAATLLHPRDGTRTGLGLNHTRAIFKQYGRPKVPWVCITITDGISKYPSVTIMEANEAARMGISMFAVGIGHKIAVAELNAIASSQKQVSTIQNFSQLQEILMQMMVTICPCPEPETYPYAKCNDGPRAIGTKRMYECEPGYMLVGNPGITCQDDFTWTPIDPTFACVPCDDNTHPIEHGFCPPGAAKTIGTVRTYQCLDGYRPIGNPTIQCLPDATWSLPDFRCVPCGDTPFIPNGACQPGGVTINAVRSLVCRNGYRAVGDPTIQCYDDPDSPTPIWSPVSFRCYPCGSVPVFANGHCEGGDDRIHSVRNLVCDPGYKPVGNGQITCLDDYAFDTPTWSPLNFRCEPCGAVPTFDYGHCDGTGFTLDTRRQLVCDNGYRPIGNPEIVCMNDPQHELPVWSPIDFKCEPCGAVPTFDYGHCDGTGNTIDTRRNLVCDHGYRPIGNPQIVCLDDPQYATPVWSPIDFQCVPCGTVPTFANGHCGGSGFTINTRRQLVCEPGYKAIGNPEIVCLDDPNYETPIWSPIDFQCVPCGDTPFIPNGACEPGDVTLNSVRSLVCRNGYRAVGDPTIQCYDDPDSPTPLWSPVSFRCYPCGSVPVFANGHCEGGDDRIHSVRNLVCDPGYKPVGNGQITCLDDYAFDTPTWSPLNFRCEPCGAVPTFDYGHCDGTGFTLDTRRQLVCDNGYRPIGNPEIVCMNDPHHELPVWSPIDFKCEPCGAVPTFDYGHCDGTGNTIDTRRNLVCDHGYRPIGNPQIVCLDDPQYPTPVWSPIDFQCVPCGTVPTFANGHCGGSGFTINTRRQLVCEPGYKAIGNPEIVCLDDPNYETPIWSPIDFQCVPCGDTPFIPNGACEPGDVTLNSVRSLVCRNGYRAVGDPTIQCYDDPDSPTPLWSPVSFRCYPCGSVPVFANGHCEGGDDRIHSVRNLVCDPGYKPVGNGQITCLDDYAFDTPTWSPLNFRCEPCGAVPTFDYGHCDGTGFTLDTRRQLVCDNGYRPIGNPEIVCMNDPQHELPVWSPIDFKCEPCGAVPTFDYGHCDGTGNTIDTRRNLVCDHGYRPIGNPQIVCLDDPQYATPVWSPIDFQCVPCGAVPTFDNGHCVQGDNKIGTIRELLCNTGYRGVGRGSLECIDDVNAPTPVWSNLDFKCVACGETPHIQHGSCGGGTFTINSVRELTCNEGYRAVGNPQIVCLDDLAYETPVWTPDFNFRCLACNDPPPVDYAFANPGPNTIGAVRAYACDSNYKMNGPGLLKCMEDGTWSGAPFNCEPIVVTPPIPIGTDPNVCADCRLLNGVGYNSHPSDCNQYVQCFIGTRGVEPVYRRCPFGLFWDQDVLTCRYPENVNCPHDKCATTTGLLAYKHTDPNICCAYWKCQFGRSVGECCGEGYSFSPVHNRCVPDPTCTSKCPYHDEVPACDLRPVLDITKYEQHLGNGYWLLRDCAPGTTFDPTLCQCALFAMGPAPTIPTLNVCTPELHLPFTHGVEDVSKNKAPVTNFGVRVIDGAAYFDGNSRLIVNMFSNTDYGEHLVIKFRYQEPIQGNYFGDLQALVTNGDCEDDPSVIIAKMPGYVLMGAKADSPASFAVPTMDQPWKDVVYYKSPKTLEGNVCGGSFFDYVYGRVQRTHCALQIGYGTGLKPFHGLISDLRVYKCRPDDMLDHGPLPHRIV
ncbi:Sushi [Mactra antiquata]